MSGLWSNEAPYWDGEVEREVFHYLELYFPGPFMYLDKGKINQRKILV